MDFVWLRLGEVRVCVCRFEKDTALGTFMNVDIVLLCKVGEKVWLWLGY